MNPVYRNRQSHLIGASVGAQSIAVYLSLSHGVLRHAAEIDWFDVLGEGCVLLFALTWIVAAIISRPPGRVTTLLVAGLNCFAFTALLDFLDESMSYSAAHEWLSMLESMPAAFGMVVMSAALIGWHKEQKALNRQLERREWSYRNHEQIDPVTQLYQADYWRARVNDAKSHQLSGCVMMLDINRFSSFNENHGYQEGDRFLQDIARLLIMHVRASDLVCRFAGDRFVFLMPELSCESATRLASDIQVSIRHLAFKCGANTTALFQSARVSVLNINDGTDADNLLCMLQSRLNSQDFHAA
ncbi:GGDEF domain-containing protein [Alteromonas confluentis]|uniref:diguanylate cyclase n=1 Tax=Alteromonas confluentis TaxID=1656094 RepID=A0A1E7ZGK0_9ALTE|nr:diguanylate cyclase [Alteromonas confluentis]OFC72639.1 hypothetical protein BFC18_01970 [Alteromonas confluentis]